MYIVGTFIGKDSLGFKNGNKYKLKLLELITEGTGEQVIMAETVEFNGKLKCIYSTIKNLLNNWSIIEFRDSTIGWSYAYHDQIKSDIVMHLRNKKLNSLI